MKKTTLLLMVLSVLLVFGFAYAHHGNRGHGNCGSPCASYETYSDDCGCGNCNCPCGSCADCGDDTQWKKFREESLALRQKMMEKRFELEKEYLKAKSDQKKTEQLEKEIDDLRAKIYEIKKTYGMGSGKTGGKGHGRCW